MATSSHKQIRNFSIIAHINHGKSTFSDRLLEITDTVSAHKMQEQLLDDMELERERGITIKAHPVTMYYHSQDGAVYRFNFIDTPGHVDFSYEVSRSLSACEGALLLVDAAQGVQAQTLANFHLAKERGLEIIPVINKVDLPAADVEGVRQQIVTLFHIEPNHILTCSAKTGIGIVDILEAIIIDIPPPQEPKDSLVRALVFDSCYDPYRGVMVHVRMMSGELAKHSSIRFLATEKDFSITEVGIFSPDREPVDRLSPGEVGYITANIKNIADVKVGDTLTTLARAAPVPLPGFKSIQPSVYAGLYPIDSDDFKTVRAALVRLQLNDSSLHIEQESSLALGSGFRCGFLGLLHLEITFERLRREFGLEIMTTLPSVVYKVFFCNGESKEIDNPAHYPDPSLIKSIEEPWVIAHIMTPQEYLGAIMGLGTEKRGFLSNMESISRQCLLLTFQFPMNEVITDFHDKLKSLTSGYGSFDYEFDQYKPSEIIKLEIKLNEETVEPLSCLTHRSKAEAKGRWICTKLKEVLPRQQFKVPIQAVIGGKVIARETLSALSKQVTAKCYGGDITRKRKLWDKQKKGKKKMKQFGKVSIPQSAFMSILQIEE